MITTLQEWHSKEASWRAVSFLILAVWKLSRLITVMVSLLPLPAGDGVLRRWLCHRPDQEHQREHAERGVDCLHLQRDLAGR